MMNPIVKQHVATAVAKVSLSVTAIAYVKQCLAQSTAAIGVYLWIKNSGCSGMSYVFDVVDQQPDDSIKFVEAENILLFVDKKCLPYVKDTVIDYLTEGLNKKIIFRNPNAQNTCGCGESFNLMSDVNTPV